MFRHVSHSLFLIHTRKCQGTASAAMEQAGQLSNLLSFGLRLTGHELTQLLSMSPCGACDTAMRTSSEPERSGVQAISSKFQYHGHGRQNVVRASTIPPLRTINKNSTLNILLDYIGQKYRIIPGEIVEEPLNPKP